MEIRSLHGSQTLSGPHFRSNSVDRASIVDMPRTRATASDSVQFSEAARNVSTMNAPESGAIRFDLVNRVRSEIASGTYETPEKLDVALKRMLG